MASENEDGPKGSGGLTFEPPSGPSEDADNIGFAPDLDDTPSSDSLFAKVAEAEPAPVTTLAAAPALRAPKTRSYPIAEAALDRLLGRAPPDEKPESLESFDIGPSVTRPPAEIATPAPAPVSMEGAPLPDLDPEDLVDMMLVGQDDGQHQIHLAFREEVMGGLYVTLERRLDGLFATFLVDDVNDRRHLESTVGQLLARLEGRGMRIAGHEVKQRD
jgi:hypothetical protein